MADPDPVSVATAIQQFQQIVESVKNDGKKGLIPSDEDSLRKEFTKRLKPWHDTYPNVADTPPYSSIFTGGINRAIADIGTYNKQKAAGANPHFKPMDPKVAEAATQALKETKDKDPNNGPVLKREQVEKLFEDHPELRRNQKKGDPLNPPPGPINPPHPSIKAHSTPDGPPKPKSTMSI